MLAVVAVVVSFIHFVRDDHDENLAEVFAQWTATEITLLRKCRATWPLMDDGYDKCEAKVKQMYRTDF